jgi:VanZ family protein
VARRAFKWVAAVAGCLAVWVGGSRVHAAVLHVLVSPWDKPVHIVLFTVVALGVGWLIGIRRARDLWLCFGLALLVGAIDEGLQAFDPTRSLDMDDLLANAVGSAIGTALHAVLWHRRQLKAVHSEDSAFSRH